MAYTTTSRQFFETILPERLRERGDVEGSPGVVEFHITGQRGGAWWVDFTAGRVSTHPAQPMCIVRAEERDFMALIEGRMSVADGLLTHRLKLAGDLGRLTRLMDAL